ncbi:MAG: 5-bromo-4-chloroindolyl phosphate hydrolysis family protein [Oscillospiraceae bacterium]|nr:5-bromo-4-chloroindolyl phosphate hydrolysis family protein [Oscillospiraceae bacterium]
MGRRRRRGSPLRSIYSFLITWLILSAFFPLYRLWGLLLVGGAAAGVAYAIGKLVGRNETAGTDKAAREKTAKKTTGSREKAPAAAAAAEPPRTTSQRVGKSTEKKSYGPEIDPIVEEGNKALSEMGRLYMSIQDPEVRAKINEIMRITDKIVQDAIQDPSDIPQIRKFMNYYLPTTIKLLHSYDRMSSVGVEGENLDKSMKNINEMLDAAIAAFKKRLDSLFANQALDIETDIEVMNTLLAREGLTGKADFSVQESGGEK